jgi:hypothetical protein
MFLHYAGKMIIDSLLSRIIALYTDTSTIFQSFGVEVAIATAAEHAMQGFGCCGHGRVRTRAIRYAVGSDAC